MSKPAPLTVAEAFARKEALEKAVPTVPDDVLRERDFGAAEEQAYQQNKLAALHADRATEAQIELNRLPPGAERDRLTAQFIKDGLHVPTDGFFVTGDNAPVFPLSSKGERPDPRVSKMLDHGKAEHLTGLPKDHRRPVKATDACKVEVWSTGGKTAAPVIPVIIDFDGAANEGSTTLDLSDYDIIQNTTLGRVGLDLYSRALETDGIEADDDGVVFGSLSNGDLMDLGVSASEESGLTDEGLRITGFVEAVNPNSEGLAVWRRPKASGNPKDLTEIVGALWVDDSYDGHEPGFEDFEI